ncbi:hypothetical protein [Rhodohalobacter halophilus]|uniref:hypothetical protein n=1 Tax=Rhodohalobacter halophilus TaxID=1812810 RepID=UPI00083F8FCC|nr:hypothetical protein [Rhodohalobacter halophilus]
MQDGARFFAYATWSIMISLAIILFSNRFLDFISEPGWIGTVILLAFGFLYLNLTFAAVKRYIRKVPAPTNLHMLLAFLVFLPPAAWIIIFAEAITTTEILIVAVLALSCGLGMVYGNRAGIKARYEYVQALKERQKEAASNSQ